jgi:hypothetical protein
MAVGTLRKTASADGTLSIEHVTSDVLHGGVNGSTGDDIREIQHAAFHVREHPCDGLCGATEPAADVLLWLARSFG